MRIAITGATGFIGRQLVKEVEARGWEPLALTREPSRACELLGGTPEIRAVNWGSDTSLVDALAGADVVVHAAAKHPPRTSRPCSDVIDFNVASVRRVLAAQPVGARFVLVSSMRALVNRHMREVDENTSYDFADRDTAYGLSKHLSEVACTEAAGQRGIRYHIVNPVHVIGENDLRPSPSGGMMLGLTRQRVLLTLEAMFALVDVRDVAAGICMVIDKGEPEKRYLLCGANLPMRDFAERVRSAAGRAGPTVVLPNAVAFCIAAACEAVERVWPGFTPPLIRSTVHYARLRPVFDGSSVTRLGLRYRDPDDTIRRATRWLTAHHGEKEVRDD